MKTDNELIAEFMGLKLVESEKGGYKVQLENGRSYWPDFQYHTSWDRLMPVVEKVESLGCIVEIWMSLGRGCRIVRPKGSLMFTSESNETLTAVYQTVIQFIKWYNNE